MNQKIMAVLMAALLVAVVGVVIVDDASDSDASVSTTGSIKVSFKDTGGNWVSTTVSAFDVYQAVDSAKTTLGYTITITGENATWNKDEGGYYNPDINYGAISQINGSSNFTIFVYNNTASQWVTAKAPLGWYRPFADYAAAVTFDDGTCAGASNVAISMDGSAPSGISAISLTAISTTDNFIYAFTLKDNLNTVNVPSGTMVLIEDGPFYDSHELTASDLQSGITIYGYGSDAYLALKNAISPVIGGEKTFELKGSSPYQYYQYYSWMDTIIGYGTQSIYGSDDNGDYSQYLYWIQSGTNSNNGGDYTLGYYSKLSGAYNDVDAFTLTYDVTEKYYY